MPMSERALRFEEVTVEVFEYSGGERFSHRMSAERAGEAEGFELIVQNPPCASAIEWLVHVLLAVKNMGAPNGLPNEEPFRERLLSIRVENHASALGLPLGVFPPHGYALK